MVRAVVAHAAGDLRVEELPVPEPRADEALIRVRYGGICGSDLHYWRHGAAGESILREPLVLGHEVVGVVEVAAADGSGPSRGTEVAVHPARLDAEQHERYPAERPNIAPGVRYLGSAARSPHTAGGFVSRLALPSAMLRPLPAGLDLRAAVLAEPAAVAWHAIARAGDVRGRRVLVIGAGPIGALVVAAASAAGAAEVVAVDLHPLPRRIATAAGARRVLDAATESTAGVDADIVIESSGSIAGLESAIRGCTRGGRVVMVGLLPSGSVAVPIASATTRELELVGAFRFHDELDDALLALAAGLIAAESIITHEFPVSQALEAFEVASDASLSGKVVLAFDDE